MPAEIMTPLSHRETFPVPKPHFNTAWYHGLQLDDAEEGEKRNWADLAALCFCNLDSMTLIVENM